MSLIEIVRRFAPGSHGYRHCYCDDHHFLRTWLPLYYFQLVGKHSGIRYGRCEIRPLDDCSQRELFWKGTWRILKICIRLNPKADLGQKDSIIGAKKLKHQRAKHASLVYSRFFKLFKFHSSNKVAESPSWKQIVFGCSQIRNCE